MCRPGHVRLDGDQSVSVEGPSARAGPGGGHRELLSALDGRQAGKSVREIAADLFGHRRVAVDWHPDGDLHAAPQRRINKACALMEQG